MKVFTEKQFITFLSRNGYTGLYFPGECACRLSDPFPCGNFDNIEECQPGVELPVPDGVDWEFCIGKPSALVTSA